MDRNWNRGGNSSTANSTDSEKNYKHSYSSNHYHYRKKNDFSGQEYYSKTVKPVLTQPVVKKESLQVALIENELMDNNFSWVKNGGTQIH